MRQIVNKTRVAKGFFVGMSVFSLLVSLSYAQAFTQEPGSSSVSAPNQPSLDQNSADQYNYPYTTDSREFIGTTTLNEPRGYTGSAGSGSATTGTSSSWQTSQTDAVAPYGAGGQQRVDKVPPTAPTNLLAGQADGQNAVLLWWSASRDTFGVQKYIVYRNGIKLAESTTTKYLDTSVAIGGQYIYFIVAQDAAGNVSERSKASALSFPVVTKETAETPSIASGSPWGPNVNTGGTSMVTTPVAGNNPDQLGGQTQGTGTRIDDGGALFPMQETVSGIGVDIHRDNAREEKLVAISSGSSSVSATLLGSTIVKNGTPGSWKEPKVQKEQERIVQKPDSQTSAPAISINSAADQDNDGLSDMEEARRGTDMEKGDTDGDGFSDGDEVKSGYSPLKYSIDDKEDRIIFQSPKETSRPDRGQMRALPKSSAILTAGYVVEKVERINYEGGKQTVQLSGKAKPNSLVTVYLYSDPVIAIVETDASGNWTYGFESELENGKHEAYVTATDNEGRITIQSDPLPFVKTAEAITTVPKNVAAEQQMQFPAEEELSRVDMFLITAISLLTLFSLGGIIIRHVAKRNARV
jgi:hypothetical protein